jgi:hypothetical protein
MITREDAIRLARGYALEIPIEMDMGSPEVRRMDGARINRLFGREIYLSDSWIIEFPKRLPPGVTECPGSVTIEILEATGQWREVYVGWTLDGWRDPLGSPHPVLKDGANTASRKGP